MTRPLAAFLKRLIWLCTAPLLLLSGWLAWSNLGEIEARHQREGANLARNLAVSIDSYLESRLQALNVLAVSPLVDEAGRQIGWMSSLADVTEPKRIRSELAAAHERFTTVLESLEAAVSVVPIESATNELAGVVEGLTLRLRGTSATPVDVDVSADREAITEAVKNLASAYSDLAKYIGEQTKYDATSKAGGPLQGDSAVGNVLARLRSVINSASGASAAFARLSDVGLELQRDGSLAVDGAKFDKALGDLAGLQKAFAHSDPLDAANEGFARRFATLTTEMLAVDGSLTTRTEGLRKLITQNGEKQSRLEDRVERYQARLVQQFTAMDSNLARLNALNSYVTQQLAGMAAANNS
ncbi:MAG: flagellar filament capping protein FliD [Phycisphaerae bacterium]|nr:flagellar filament capping protein FliD [Phycisphaerae bacterium]